MFLFTRRALWASGSFGCGHRRNVRVCRTNGWACSGFIVAVLNETIHHAPLTKIDSGSQKHFAWHETAYTSRGTSRLAYPQRHVKQSSLVRIGTRNEWYHSEYVCTSATTLMKRDPKYNTSFTSLCHTAAAHFRNVYGGSEVLSLLKRDVLLGVYLCKSFGHLAIGRIGEHLAEERMGKGGEGGGRIHRGNVSPSFD